MRAIVAAAGDGDTIDLRELPVRCGNTHVTIALQGHSIAVAQASLNLLGPSPSVGTVTISSAHADRVLDHTGTGVLTISDLTIANGEVTGAAGDVRGGCIQSEGGVSLVRSRVTGCKATASGIAYGGGIFAAAGLAMNMSQIEDSHVVGNYAGGGGALTTGGLDMTFSSITANSAVGMPSVDGSNYSFGGGALALGAAAVSYSTIASNAAGSSGGIGVYGSGAARIGNSTISGNSADFAPGIATGKASTRIFNSTIAFNVGTVGAAGIAFVPYGPQSFDLESSIVSNNTRNGTPLDVQWPSDLTLSGGYNLVMSSIGSVPANFIVASSDPLLQPLAKNGGTTMTHVVTSGSAALGAGADAQGSDTDQRGIGYPRTTGTSVDIGATQFDEIFPGPFE